MKRKITLSFWDPPREEKTKQPEEVTLYGQGAGLYSYLNVLAQTFSAPGFDRSGVDIRQ